MAGRQGPPDRRSRRTRRLVAEALVALMLEKRYDRVTVREIIERADVGRSTFYAHYRGKDDVLAGEFERVLDLLHAQHLAGGDDAGQLLPSLGLFRHVREHQPLYRALVRGGGADLLYDSGHRHLRDAAERRLAALVAGGHPPPIPLPILADYLAGTLLALLRWWLDHQLPYPPEQMDAIFRRLALPGVRAALRHDGHGTQ